MQVKKTNFLHKIYNFFILIKLDNTTRQAAEQWLEEFKNNNFVDIFL